MSKVKKLDPSTIKLIAAGEVVERPASALKEILENSLDAGATKIEVHLIDGGKSLIHVIDNGVGLSAEDARLAFEMHATSKIESSADLLAISSFGFRGEALASIAAVSKVELNTFSENEPTSVTYENFTFTKVAPKRFVTGTEIKIHNLFGSLPARAKFLRSAATEFAACQDVFTGLALSRIDVDWQLTHNGRETLRLPNALNLSERVFGIWPDLSKKSYVLNTTRADMQISGLIGTPEAARKDRKQQIILVNGRAVQDRILQKAVSEAFRGFLHRDLYPAYVIRLDLSPEKVDVNVHPRKQEVKFADSQQVYMLAMTSIRDLITAESKKSMQERLEVQDSLSNNTPLEVVKVHENNEQNKGFKSQTTNYLKSYATQNNPRQLNSPQLKFNASPSSYLNNRLDSSQSGVNQTDTLHSAERETHNQQTILGFNSFHPWQLWATYIVYEHEENVIFVDQHAAAEKIRYEKLRKELGTPKKQKLLVPEIIELTAEIHEKVLNNLQALDKIGLEVNDFGGNSIQVTAKPEIITNLDVEKLVNQLFKDKAELNIKISESRNAEIIESKVDDLTDWEQTNPDLHMLIATAACHGSIRAGQKLSVPEMQQILIDLNKCQYPYNCPHGRPVSFVMSKKEVESQFKRII